MPEVMNNVVAWFSTPLGQVALSIGAYLIAKRFPAFQSLVWFLLDALKVPRPNVPTPSPSPTPAPTPGPTPTPGPAPAPSPVPELGGLLSQLLSALVANKQHNAAAELISLASRIEEAKATPKGDA